MKKLKVLMIYHQIGYGGANKMLAFLANTLSSRGFEVHIYTYESNEEPHYKLNERIHLIKEKKYYKRSHKNKVYQFINVIKHIGKLKPDIVISFMSTSNFFATIGARLNGVPNIISERGNPESEKGVFAWLKQKSLLFTRGAVFQTEGAKVYFPRVIQERSIVIPNPVMDINREALSWDERHDEIVFVARFEIKQKRQDIMVKAFQKIAKKYESYKLIFYGEGQDMEEIVNLVNSLSLNDRVIFKGKVENVVDEIINSKLFVLSSDYEGIPNALIEAMSLGLTCISTDCDPGGARLLIKNNINGVLIPKGNDESLSEAIDYLINNPNIAEEIGKNARSIQKIFKKEKIQDMWVDYISKIVSIHCK
jgi:glycosyltransferase involved in cell wall biosynthesis